MSLGRRNECEYRPTQELVTGHQHQFLDALYRQPAQRQLSLHWKQLYRQ